MSRSTTAASRVAVVLLAAAVCALAAQSASAAWYVGGTALTGSAAVAATATVAEPIKLKAAGVTVECSASNASIASGEIKAPKSIAANSIVFNECKATTGKCTVSKSIATTPVLAELTEQTLEDVATLVPKKSPLATIKYEGAECALAGTQPLTGKAAIKLPFGNQEETLQEVRTKVLESTGELKLGSSAAELKGAVNFKLTSGLGFEWLALLPSKEFRLTVNKPVLKKNETATFTILSLKANAEVTKIEIDEDPGEEFEDLLAEINFCGGLYKNIEESCKFNIKYTGEEEATYRVEIKDKEGDTRVRVVRGGP